VTAPAVAGGHDRLGLSLLVVAVVSVGAAAVLVRLAQAPALTTSFVRLAIGGAVLSVAAVARRARRQDTAWPALRPLVVAGVLLAAHFALWIASLSRTTVAASVVLVCLQPVFVALLAGAVLREAIGARVGAGIVVALVGAVVIAFDPGGATPAGVDSGATTTGNLLALGGAVAIALYVLVLRSQRGDVLVSSAIVTSTAAVTLLPACIATGAPLLPSTSTQAAWLLALALFPQVIGHTALNAALQRLPAAIVSGSILAEPVIASALAWLALGERPGPATLLGGGVTLVGVAVLLSRSSSTPQT
jgi:drug/metabolite transporter (DMT)-like permease